ncbi:MAG: YcxB family protein [Ruminococcaceae bacterium]|nr:YcxB family protein [Oscillospiraceae bacterium]
MRFVNQTVYDRAALTVYFRVRRTLLHGKRRVVPYILLGVLAAAEFFTLVMSLLAGEPGQLVRSTVFMAVVVALFFCILMQDALQARFTLNKLDPAMRDYETVFDEDGFVVSTEETEMQCGYDCIRYSYETQDYFLFFISKEKGKIFAKKGFDAEEIDAFRAFIAEKTGSPVEYSL